MSFKHFGVKMQLLKCYIYYFVPSILLFSSIVEGNRESCMTRGGVIVHLFEWSWNAIANECEDFLGPQGYCGVQISPPNEHILGSEWWTRYQPVSYILESRSGTHKEFESMVSRCKSVGVEIIVDLVINHMSAKSSYGLGSGGSPYNGIEQSYPEYSPFDFHQPPCEVDNYLDAYNVRNCYLVSLNDLDGGSEYVRQKTSEYAIKLLRLGVGGFRIDAAKHMWPEDIRAIQDKISASHNGSVYILEVIFGEGEAIHPDEYVNLGKVTEFRASSWISCIKDQGFHCLNGYGENMLNGENAVVSVDNHDNQRGHGGDNQVITHRNPYLYKMATAFLLAHSYGQKRVMSSYYFENSDQGPPQTNPQNCYLDGWVCEHRWPEISNMIQFVNFVKNAEVQHYQNKENVLGFARGNIGFVALGDFKQRPQFYTGLPDGTYCDIISNCNWNITILNGYGTVIKNDEESPVFAICINDCNS